VLTPLDDLEFAHALTDLAGELALTYFDRGVVARTKADGTPITDADLAVERVMREHLNLARPHDAIYGEEFGRSGQSDRTWLIDPIDGTRFFAAADPHWRVHVALQVAGETVVSVVGAPALRMRWWATRDGGAFESSWSPTEHGSPTVMRVSSTAQLHEARVAVFPPAARPLVPERCAVVQAGPLHLVDVLRGALDGYVVACCHAWDHAPWILLVEEAGGRFTDWAGGHAPDRGGGIFSNAALHPHLTATWPFI
jgi:histidinol-phosphatase